MNRGYCGIGLINTKSWVNYGTLFRSAFAFDADFIFLIGKRFKKQHSDTVASFKHLPLFEYETFEQFQNNRPYNCPLICIEITDSAIGIRNFSHPERAIYLLGPEDGNIPKDILAIAQAIVQIPTRVCLNLAVTGSIVLYDRMIKRGT